MKLARAFTSLGLALLLLTIGSPGLAAQDAPADPGALKRLSLEELMALEVTSVSRAPEAFGQAAAAIQVITGAQIRRSGATTLADALRLATNLAVAQKNSHTWAISARGFNTDLANKLLVLIDGRTVYTPLFSGVFWDRQDYLLEDVDRIEVVSGPGGTLWGANAVNGVINIITRGARDSRGVYATAGGGTQARTAGARYGGSLASGVAFRVYGKYLDRDEEALPDGEGAGDGWSRGQGGFRVDADLSPRDRLTVQGDLYDGEHDLATGGSGDASGLNVLGRWSRAFGDASELRVQAYFDRTHLRIPVPASIQGEVVLAPAGELEDDLDTYDVDVQHRFAAGSRHRIVWGGGYRFTHNEVASAPGLAFDPPTLDRSLFSLFAQDEIAVAPTLDLTVGSKLEHNDYTGFEVEPSVRLRWSAADGHVLWGAVSRAVRMPSRVDRHERLPTPGFAPVVENLLVGNDRFVSETLVAYELGWRAQAGTRAALSLATFYNRYDDLRSTSTTPPEPPFNLPFPFFFANDLEADSYGAELVADVEALPGWRLRGGYTYFHHDVRVKPGRSDFNAALNETADPKHQVGLRSALDLPGGVEVDAGLRWIGSFRYNVSGVADTVPSYAEADARVAWHPTPNVELSVSGANLLDDQHLEYVISSPNPRVEIRRSVQGRIAIRW